MRPAIQNIWFRIIVFLLALAALVFAILTYVERSREVSGVLLYQFEGSNFFEGATIENVRSFSRSDAGWLEIPANSPIIASITSGNEPPECWEVTAFELRFVGRRLLGRSGHLSAWSSSYEITKLLEFKEMDWPECDSPYDWDDADG